MVDHTQLGRQQLDHELDVFDSDAISYDDQPHRITEQTIELYAKGLEQGLSSKMAAKRTGFHSHSLHTFLRGHPELCARVDRARVEWASYHLSRLADPGDGSGASAKVRASLGALASVDERYRKPRAIVGGNVNVNVNIPDMRPAIIMPGGMGDPARYALPGNGGRRRALPEPIDAETEDAQPQGLVGAVIEGAKAARERAKRPPAGVRRRRAKAKKGTKKKRRSVAGPGPGPAPIL